MKKKLNLSKLKVSSFVTQVEPGKEDTIKGGGLEGEYGRGSFLICESINIECSGPAMCPSDVSNCLCEPEDSQALICPCTVGGSPCG